jgi:hypothetical protein
VFEGLSTAPRASHSNQHFFDFAIVSLLGNKSNIALRPFSVGYSLQILLFPVLFQFFYFCFFSIAQCQ